MISVWFVVLVLVRWLALKRCVTLPKATRWVTWVGGCGWCVGRCCFVVGLCGWRIVR